MNHVNLVLVKQMFLPPGCLSEEEEALSSLKKLSLLLYCELTVDKIF